MIDLDTKLLFNFPRCSPRNVFAWQHEAAGKIKLPRVGLKSSHAH